MTTRTWIGRLDTDHWDRPICDGWPIDLTPYVGRRVEIIVREVGTDPESYEALARRHAGEADPDAVKAPATEGTHSVSRPTAAGAARILYSSVRDV